MKKWKKFFMLWMGLGFIGLLLDFAEIIDLHGRPSAAQEEARATFISDWNNFVGKKAEITGNTIVVYTQNETNPFQNPDDYAGEYHPRLVNGQSCKNLGIGYIHVRSSSSNKLLSGIACVD